MNANRGNCTQYVPKWHYNWEKKACSLFKYGGCGGNQNRFDTREECEHECSPRVPVCLLPFEKGPCVGDVSSWYFNYLTKKCEEFSYGGCYGNANRFKSLYECENRCFPTDICHLEPESGPCKSIVVTWYHNSTTDTCEQFQYSGCLGNQNNFFVKDDCEKTCILSSPRYLPMKVKTKIPPVNWNLSAKQ